MIKTLITFEEFTFKPHVLEKNLDVILEKEEEVSKSKQNIYALK